MLFGNKKLRAKIKILQKMNSRQRKANRRLLFLVIRYGGHTATCMQKIHGKKCKCTCGWIKSHEITRPEEPPKPPRGRRFA